jgi:pimeloyl-ACP methyl ester carboxylesterase
MLRKLERASELSNDNEFIICVWRARKMNNLPIGSHSFSKNKIINYELNRWYSFGLARIEDLQEAVKSIKTIEDNKAAFMKQAKKAEAEGRLANAAIYYRAAEFYVPGDDPNKLLLYDKFLECFYKAFEKDNIKRIDVPYQGSYLRALQLKPETEIPKGTIVIHGGFDSLIEEFYYVMDYFRKLGYEVIAFEGPGQGYTLRKYRLALDHDWEKPTGAILDYFRLDNVTLIGISLGGYWCLRAAAFEPRIKKVVAYGLVYDYMELPGKLLRKVTEWFLKKPERAENSIKIKMKLNQNHRWITNQWVFITQSKSVGEVPLHMLRMNQDHMHPEKVLQDVLLLTGEDDEFFPARLMEKQKANLINAHSVTSRIFTKEENAASHCQVGNVGLALKTISDWMVRE